MTYSSATKRRSITCYRSTTTTLQSTPRTPQFKQGQKENQPPVALTVIFQRNLRCNRVYDQADRTKRLLQSLIVEVIRKALQHYNEHPGISLDRPRSLRGSTSGNLMVLYTLPAIDECRRTIRKVNATRRTKKTVPTNLMDA